MKGFQGTASYITSQALRDSVDVSVALGRPLLIKGEPGTGKTLLAHAIAEDLKKKILVWNVKSTTTAVQGLYVYDTVQRLHDSRFGDRDVADIRQYIQLGPLGRALTAPERVVLLIDEIDKADLEFPNDLLHELDRMSFTIPETGDSYEAKERPIVVITSNAEKELPDAFLRRCIFYYIDFPDAEMMQRILDVHFPALEEKLAKAALDRFYWIREFSGIKKKPSTSELVDWVQALLFGGIDPARIAEEMPFLGTLLKKPEDIRLVRERGLYRRKGAF
ncbi:MAG: MoxR family ATPase [Planctomycetes bacterium]|nr:MoxR family ATPase [Planctomycetota bacterium]